jgi:hypothetical protein
MAKRAERLTLSSLPVKRSAEWGFLPALSLVSASGLVLVALADNGGRSSAAWATPLFWISLLVLFVPTAWRLLSLDATRNERIGLVMVLGGVLYLVKVLRDPLAFTYFDEFEHLPTANSILQTHHLFHANPVLRISPLFPGLETVVSALASMGGLSIFEAGIVVIGVARFVLVLALYLLYESTSHSPRVAGLAVLLYMANPNYLYFDAEFAYESLSLALAALVLFVIARQTRTPTGGRWGLSVTAILGIGAVVVTHHLTSYILAMFLIAWTVAALYIRPRTREWVIPGSMAVVALIAIVAWFAYAASPVLGYLLPPLTRAIDEFTRLLTGHRAARVLFRGGVGQAPLWDIVTGYASVALILLALPFGLWRFWPRRRADALALVLVGGALAYPVSLVLRLTQAGTETSNRSSEFLFVGIAFVLATMVVEWWVPRHTQWTWSVAFVTWAAIIFVGGITIGTAPSARLPGPYLVGADQRSVDAVSVTAARWANAYLGPGSRLFTDRTNRQLMGSYGGQDPQTGRPDVPDMAEVFLSRRFDAVDREIIRAAKVHYLVVDRRFSDALPLVGYYYDASEPGAFQHKKPVPAEALAKFDHVRGVSRIFDSGAIVIYDVGAIADCAKIIDQQSQCSDGAPVGASVPGGHPKPTPSVQPSTPTATSTFDILLNPNVVSFGHENAHTVSPVTTIHVVNIGTKPRAIAHISIDGRNRHEFHEVNTCSGVTIAVDAGCTIKVSFTPVRGGTHRAYVVISAGAGGDVKDVPLHGQ